MAIRIEERPIRGNFSELEPVISRTKQNMWHKLHRLFGRDDSPSPGRSPNSTANTTANSAENRSGQNQQPGTRRDFGGRVGVGLPRPGTFRRQNSEKRDRLEPIRPCLSEKRAVSAQRQQRSVSAYRAGSTSSPPPRIPAQVSAPSLSLSNVPSDRVDFTAHASHQRASTDPTTRNNGTTPKSLTPYGSPSRSSSETFDEFARDEKNQIDLELDTKWILNLSMHFRDKSDREKFFITFAEEPNRWRRVTISCDYRNAEPESLETDLKELQYQRDKNAQIYESIRDSLPSIQFYNTVTNLKLETEHGRLHVHVTEDVNEVIPYPPRLSVQHLLTDRVKPIREARESQIVFQSHLSGFVYKVGFQGQEYIKKEIPGPDTVDEFLYEVNALHALSHSASVIQLEAIVLDDTRQTVKGLLLSYAERGALVDLLYDHKEHRIPWVDRMRWSRQAVQGLSEIHEEGYVQGDFTLTNIVVNNENDAKIIDINRRGCPVGWEPPEIANKIASNQRISMYIGQKSDLYQLGMTLWALAMHEDEPERHDQPLNMAGISAEVPEWFKEIVTACLSPQPRHRLSAKELLQRFPPLPTDHAPHKVSRSNEILNERSPKRYIEPCAAVEREDLERLGRPRRRSTSEGPSTEDASLIDPPPSSYQFDSGSSFVGIRRRIEPPSHSQNVDERDFGHVRSEIYAVDAWDEGILPPRIISISPGREPRYEELDSGVDLSQEYQSSALFEHSTLLEHQDSRGKPPQSDEQMTHAVPAPSSSALPEARHLDEGQTVEADLELPSPHHSHPAAATISITSESTPRNAPSILATSTSSIIPPPALDLAKADLVGFGGHPTLDQYSPHEPMKCADIQASQYYDTQAEPQHILDSTDIKAEQQDSPDSTGIKEKEHQLSSDPTDLAIPVSEPDSSNIVEPPSETLSADVPDLPNISESAQSMTSSTTAPEEIQPLPIPS